MDLVAGRPRGVGPRTRGAVPALRGAQLGRPGRGAHGPFRAERPRAETGHDVEEWAMLAAGEPPVLVAVNGEAVKRWREFWPG